MFEVTEKARQATDELLKRGTKIVEEEIPSVEIPAADDTAA